LSAFRGEVKAARVGIKARTKAIELPSRGIELSIAEVNNDPKFAFAVEFLERAIKANAGQQRSAITAVLEVLLAYKRRSDVALSLVEEKFPDGDLKTLSVKVLNGEFHALTVPT
jgi:hypothetical protein